ncbi:31741_t:CDS:2, partial [Racocetra persica]
HWTPNVTFSLMGHLRDNLDRQKPGNREKVKLGPDIDSESEKSNFNFGY